LSHRLHVYHPPKQKMERVGLLNEESHDGKLFPAPSKLILFIFGAIACVGSLAFYIWAVVKIWPKKEGYDLGTMTFVIEFFAGLASVYAAIRTTRWMTTTALLLHLLGTAAITIGYGAGSNPIFSDPRYIVPMYAWIGVGTVLTAAAATSAVYDGLAKTRPVDMYPVIRTNMITSFVVIIASIVFFSWAQYNTLQWNPINDAGSAVGGSGDFDIGIICFFVTAMAGFTGVYASADRTPFFGCLQLLFTAAGLAATLACYGFAFWLAFSVEMSLETRDAGVKHLAIGSGIWGIGLIAYLLIGIFSFRQVRHGSREAGARYPF